MSRNNNFSLSRWYDQIQEHWGYLRYSLVELVKVIFVPLSVSKGIGVVVEVVVVVEFESRVQVQVAV